MASVPGAKVPPVFSDPLRSAPVVSAKVPRLLFPPPTVPIWKTVDILVRGEPSIVSPVVPPLAVPPALKMQRGPARQVEEGGWAEENHPCAPIGTSDPITARTGQCSAASPEPTHAL